MPNLDGLTSAAQLASSKPSQSAPLHARGVFGKREAVRSGYKRKRDDSEQDAFVESFTIEAQPSKPSSQSINLRPVIVIDRSCLPLAYLDLTGNANGIPGTRLFAARILTIENALQRTSHAGPVLIARSCGAESSLYAIERADADLYALCALGEWVTVKMLDQLQGAGLSMPTLKKPRHQRMNPHDSDWWRDLAIKDRETSEMALDKRRINDMRNPRLCLKRRQTKDSSPVQAEPQPPAGTIEQPESSSIEISVNLESGELPQQSTEDIFGMLRAQYQENLYNSKASLAYFAKGPLSRARASLGGNAASPLGLPELATHLRSSILPTATMDKKYKEAVPLVVQSLPAEILPKDDTSTFLAEVQKKIRKTKKQKISKDGVYPGEELNVARWWLGRDACDTPGNAEDSMKSSLLELRARETQMQIVLLLETLALEASISTTKIGSTIQEVVSQVENDSQMKKRKPKKPQDLNVLLDILVDRLCIWQSMRVDDDKPSNDHENQSQTQIRHTDRGVDTLKVFCVDVVLPFYGARLPEISTMLRQKLGGLKTPSPMRPPLAKAASSTQLGQRPGIIVQRPGVRKPRPTLERVLTDEKAALQRRAPGLSRSFTDSALPGLKREASDTSLNAIPLNRVALHKSKRYTRREVDLKAVSQAAEAKAKKKANVAQELQGAIAALKKPNPRMAVKELVEAAEKRAAGSHGRKSKNPVRNLFAQGVQVNATPKGDRRKDVFGGLPRLPQPSREIDSEPDAIPPSSLPRVPSTVVKHLAPPPRIQQHSSLGRAAQPVIEQTPTRRPSRYTSNLLNPSQPSESNEHFLTPTKPRRPMSASNVRATGHSQPTHNRPSSSTPQESASGHLVQETPLKPHARAQSGLNPLGESIIITSSPPTGGNSTSIYDALGWNDFHELS